MNIFPSLVGSCEIVALRENVDKPESYDSFSAKMYISCVRKNKKRARVGVYFLHPHTQPASKQGINIFLRRIVDNYVEYERHWQSICDAL
jgi:hypothetical protein